MEKNKKFFFSIIIPFFLLRKKDNFFLQKCLESLKTQSLEQKFYEILLINDGSAIPISKQIKNGLPTIPSTIKEELDCNIFLRTNDLEGFSKLRDLKDNF